MFKEASKDFIQALERYNQDPNNQYFFFCASDLQPSPNRQLGELNFDIHSSELRQKLGDLIISEGGTMSNPSVIKFAEIPENFAREGGENWFKEKWNWIRINKNTFIQMVNASKGRIIEFSKEQKPRRYSLKIEEEILLLMNLEKALAYRE